MIKDDIRTVEMQLPTTVKGFSMALMDGTYCIVLNSKMNFEQKMNTYTHEMEHIKNGDFESFLNANTLETLRH